MAEAWNATCAVAQTCRQSLEESESEEEHFALHQHAGAQASWSKRLDGQGRRRRRNHSGRSAAKRLRLEYTFVQGSENELLGLITEFNKAVCETPLGSPLRRHKLMEAAKAVNRVRLCLGDPFEELTQKWRAYCVDALSNSPGEGERHAHMHPRTILRAAASMGKEGVPAPKLWFASGPLRGQEIQFNDFVGACELYKGGYCSLDYTVCPPQISKIGRQLAYYEEKILRLYKKVGQAPTHAEALALGEHLMGTIDEHCSLRVLLLWSNWRLLGRAQLKEPLIGAPTWNLIMKELRLTDVQMELSRSVRAGIRKDVFEAQVAKECSEDIVNAIADSDLAASPSFSERLSIFDAVSAVHNAAVQLELLEVKSSCIFMQGVLTPIQKCFLTGLIQSRVSQVTGSQVVSFADLNKFIHGSVCDDDMSRWMDAPDAAEL